MTTYRPSKFVRRKYPKIDNTEPTYTMMSKELARITLFLYNKGVEEQTLINSRYEDRYRAYKWELPHDNVFHIMYRGAYARLNGITGLPATRVTFCVRDNMLHVAYKSAHLIGAADFIVPDITIKDNGKQLMLRDKLHYLCITYA